VTFLSFLVVVHYSWYERKCSSHRDERSLFGGKYYEKKMCDSELSPAQPSAAKSNCKLVRVYNVNILNQFGIVPHFGKIWPETLQFYVTGLFVSLSSVVIFLVGCPAY